MKKNGFTLVELLAVLIIVTIILSIAIRVITKTVDRAVENMYQEQVTNIEKYASLFAADNYNYIGDSATININMLLSNGYINDELKDPRDKSVISGDTRILIEKTNGEFNYTVIEEDFDDNTTTNADYPLFFLNSNYQETILTGSTYNDLGVTALTPNTLVPLEVTKIIKENESVVPTVDTTTPSVFTITYETTYNSNTFIITKTVTVTN